VQKLTSVEEFWVLLSWITIARRSQLWCHMYVCARWQQQWCGQTLALMRV